MRPRVVDGRSEGLEIRVRGVLPAQAGRVFAELTEPDRIRAHPGVLELVELEPGTEVAHGPGAVREVRLPSGRFRERVLGWDPPWRLDYAAEAIELPIEHYGGNLSLREVSGGTEVLWRSAFSVRMGPIGPLVTLWAAHRMAGDLAWHLDAAGEAIRGARLPRHGPRLGWVLVPIALWNLGFAGALPDGIGADEGVPAALLAAENTLRVAAFVAIALARAHPRATARQWGVLVVGVLVYFASWLPLLIAPVTASQPFFALAPAVTPALFLAALAWLGRSRVLAVLGTGFWVAHVVHQLW